MKAFVYDRYGSPDILEFKGVDQPAIDDERVLVRVRRRWRQGVRSSSRRPPAAGEPPAGARRPQLATVRDPTRIG
jgi:hypothetical protein